MLHTVPFTSPCCFETMSTFSWLFSFTAFTGQRYSRASTFLFLDESPAINPLQSQIESQYEHTSFSFPLLKSYNTKCRHSQCWCLQNTRGCISMLWLRSSQHHISCTFDHDDLPHSCIYCTVECFVADLVGSHCNQISCLCEQHFLGFNFYWQILRFYCLAKHWLQSLSCHSCMICKHHGSFYQVYKYHLEDISYSLVLSHGRMFYKPASPSTTGQM